MFVQNQFAQPVCKALVLNGKHSAEPSESYAQLILAPRRAQCVNSAAPGCFENLFQAVGGNLRDQYLEFFTCDSLGQEVLLRRGAKVMRNGSNKGDAEIISNGSKIAVPEGTALILVDNGRVVDFTTEAGMYTWDTSSAPTCFGTSGFLDGVKATVPKLWDVITQSISVVSSLFTLTMVVLYTLLILLDYERLTTGWPRLLPERYRPFATQLVRDVEESMNKYFRGQAMVAFCVGVLFSIGFLIIDFPMAVGLGLFIGLLNMVPYLQLIGFVPTILLAIVKAAETGQNFWMIMLMAVVVFAVVQAIQDAILTPKIMGHVTGLNSAIILLSLSIWGSLMGILGMIIALPMTTLLISYYQKYIVKNK